MCCASRFCASLPTPLQDAPFNLGSEIASQRLWTLRELVKVLRRVYADSVGVEIAHLTDPSEKHWLRDQLEQHNAYMPPDFVRARALKHLVEVDCFEAALAKAFPAAKRWVGERVAVLVPHVMLVAAQGLESTGVRP